MIITGKKIILRFIEPDDLETIRAMSNDPEQERMIVGWSFPTAKKHQEDWYQRILADRNSYRFAMEYEGRFVGLATLTDIDWKNRSAIHGIRLALDAPRCQGLGTDGVFAIMKYAFEELGLNRIYTTILDYNIPSQKLYEKCGWKIEGRLRNSIFKNGNFHDEFCVGILKSDYLEWKESIKY